MTSETTNTSAPATPAPTRAQVRATEQAAARSAKVEANAARKAANAAKRADGVIGTLHNALQTPQGTTKAEIVGVLTIKFPERDPIGMSTTVGIQLSRLQAKHGKIVSRKVEGRGLVYGYETTVQFPAEGSQGTPTPAPAKVEKVETTESAKVEAPKVVRRPGGKKQ